MYAIRLIEPASEVGCAPEHTFQEIGDLLRETEALLPRMKAHIRRIGVNQPGIATSLTMEMRGLEAETFRLRGVYQRRTSGSGHLGAALLLLAAGGAIVAGVGALYQFVLKNRDKAIDLEQQSSYYDELIEAGTDPNTAAKLAAGKYSAWPEILTKAGLILAVLVGLYVFIKLKK